MGICYSICCLTSDADNGVPVFANDDNIIPEGKRPSDSEEDYTISKSTHDGAPLLRPAEMKLITVTNSSDGSFNEEVINKMMEEAGTELNESD